MLAAALGPMLPGILARGSGLAVRTEVGPTCAAERAGRSCPPGHVGIDAIITWRGWPAVAAVGSGAQFRISLAPGRYTLHVLRPRQALDGSPFPRAERTTIPVTVHRGAYTQVTVGFDSGIA